VISNSLPKKEKKLKLFLLSKICPLSIRLNSLLSINNILPELLKNKKMLFILLPLKMVLLMKLLMLIKLKNFSKLFFSVNIDHLSLGLNFGFINALMEKDLVMINGWLLKKKLKKLMLMKWVKMLQCGLLKLHLMNLLI
jgi:hypothetical protein